MSTAPCSRGMGKLNCAVVILCLSLWVFPARSDDSWHLLVEPKFLAYEAAWPIAGSQKTVLVPARYSDGQVYPLRSQDIQAHGISRQSIEAAAPAAAAKVLSSIKPRYVRDDRDVIQYAILESDSPLTASAVLAPGFEDLFAETLGPDLLVAIPNRYRIYVFSKQSPAYLRLSEQVIIDYGASSQPVSKEVFAVENGTLSAVGSYR